MVIFEVVGPKSFRCNHKHEFYDEAYACLRDKRMDPKVHRPDKYNVQEFLIRKKR